MLNSDEPFSGYRRVSESALTCGHADLATGIYENGMEWLRRNVASLRNQLMLLQKLYSTTWILA